MCGFIAQLVEHRTGIAEVTGSNPVEALIFFQASSFQLLELEIYCDDHSSLSQWVFVKFSNIVVKAVIDRQPLLGTGPLPDWLRNHAHDRALVSLDTCRWPIYVSGVA